MTEVLRQADPRWTKLKVGRSRSTMGAVGCLVTCYAQAMRELGVDLDADPRTVLARGVFSGAAMWQQDTAKSLGLVADDVTRVTDVHRVMRTVLTQTLGKGDLVVMHVDHDSTKVKGDVDGDHFVLGLRIEDADVIFADPATGRLERLDSRMLTCPVMWGTVVRPYQVRSVRPLRRAA